MEESPFQKNGTRALRHVLRMTSLIILVSLWIAASVLPAASAASGFQATTNTDFLQSKVVGNWGNQKTVATFFRVVESPSTPDPDYNYYITYVETLYKGGCHYKWRHTTTYREWLPYSKPDSPDLLSWDPGSYWQWADMTFTISTAGAAVSWHSGGSWISYGFTESYWDEYWGGGYGWDYARGTQDARFTNNFFKSYWGKMSSSTAVKMAQITSKYVKVHTLHQSGICPFDFGYTDSAETSWIVLPT